MNPSWRPKLIVPCLFLVPFVARAQRSLELASPVALESARFSEPKPTIAPENLQNFATKTTTSCEESKVLPSRTSESSWLAAEPAAMFSDPLTVKRQKASCGRIADFSHPVDVASLPLSSCPLGFPLEMSGECIVRPTFLLPLSHTAGSSSFANPVLAVQNPRARFGWKPALWQSFEFLVMEHAFRLSFDSYARYLLFHKPFWHDYLSSADHFDMSRWGDGDSFIVNYIGHPLEGAVSGNIFIQNDPTGRSARFGKSSAYWQSRFKAMTWAAVYSAYFEIGPILSETALGNEGGYTYQKGCHFDVGCAEARKPATNNTGWVDFVATPVVGMGWIVLEDAIEVELVDKVVPDHRSITHNLLLAGLTPSRTMSNFLAGKHPWYRASAERESTIELGPSLSSIPKRADWKNDPRRSLGLQFTSLNLPMDWEGCQACRSFTPGVGLTFGYRVTRFAAFDSEANLYPGTGSTGKRGGAQELLAGVKIGRTFRSWGAFSQVRPGFIRYDKTLVPGSSTNYESATRFALDLGGSVEYYASHHSTLRLNAGVTLVHYLAGHTDPMQPPVNVLSPDYYATQGNFHITSGYVFRF